MLDHDPIETQKAVHAWHMNVERDDIGAYGCKFFETFRTVAGEIDLELGDVAEDATQQLAHEGRVVDDEDLDHEGACAPLSNLSSKLRSARVRSSAGSKTRIIRPSASILTTP